MAIIKSVNHDDVYQTRFFRIFFLSIDCFDSIVIFLLSAVSPYYSDFYEAGIFEFKTWALFWKSGETFGIYQEENTLPIGKLKINILSTKNVIYLAFKINIASCHITQYQTKGQSPISDLPSRDLSFCHFSRPQFTDFTVIF